ncbi:HTH-type transcriptional activator CmpR [mine drainage metagenome]|uniref:HTH-type transcriptional activator CmpR n=1 Tax=mine drainage metagenome TaxID=410659 RepID=A0A1J5T2I0_9ZZZZ
MPAGRVTAVPAVIISMPSLLDSRQLLAFSTLARVGSFTLAAKELGLTQSAISHAMKALEEEIGCRLCDRAGRRVMLTQAGEQFLQHVDKILVEMRAARVGIENLNNWGHLRLRVGASTTACQYILPSVLREFKQRYPRCTLAVEPGDFSRQLELLETKQTDLALMIEPPDQRDWAFVPLFEDELRLLVAPSHRWVKEDQSVRGPISDETLILYSKTSLTFRLIQDYFSNAGISLGHFIELGSMEAIKELAKLGVGVGVVSPWVARNELAQGTLISFPLGTNPLRRRWGVVYSRQRKLSLSEETFVSLCRLHTASFGPDDGRAASEAHG